MIRSTNCIDEYVRMNSKTVSWYYANPELRFPDGGEGQYQKFEDTLQCHSNTLEEDHSKVPWKTIDLKIDENHQIESASSRFKNYSK